MNDTDRDKILSTMSAEVSGISGDMKVVLKTLKSHDDTLYGNGKDGVVVDVTLLKDRQESCPARQASTVAGKRLGLGYVMVAIAIIGIIVSIAVAIHSK